MSTGWKARLGQNRISLVLQLLVLFTLIISSLNALLSTAVAQKRAELAALGWTMKDGKETYTLSPLPSA